MDVERKSAAGGQAGDADSAQRADDQSPAAKIYRGASPSNDGTDLSTAVMPDGFPMAIAPERREESAPGLDKELLALIQVTAEAEVADAERAGT